MFKPAPEVLLYFDEPYRTYTNSSAVKGHVVINVKQGETLEVTVKLYGRTWTRIREGNDTYHSDVLHFTKSQTLHAAGGTLQRGQHTLPFLVAFPDEHPLLRHSLLPPSLARSSELRCTGATIYKIEAKVERASGFRRGWTDKNTVSFMPSAHSKRHPSAPQPYNTTRALEVKSLLLLPENAGRQLTIKEKIYSIFHRSSLPIARFNITVTQPAVICTSNFWISFSVRLENLTDAPTVLLKSFRAKIIADTWTRPKTTQKRPPTIPGALKVPPGFTISNMSRSYRLETHAVVVCVGKERKIRSMHPLTVEWKSAAKTPKKQQVSAVGRSTQIPALTLDASTGSGSMAGKSAKGEEMVPSYEEALTW
ncbi:hypothetical protein H2199_008848 [Coniosporium tulheliwenetii]|uniref:Uncharacterized protein n=1 Tax=Coniosporium tulheliwenetii TaxID=3383036 RepID=A0ACC2YGW3_9PEZI|nr:hypothetical protein H2199_008848 [Cladosporium sp. JES 115]